MSLHCNSALLARITAAGIAVIAAAFFFAADAAQADDISARAAVVIDGSDGRILYGKNPNLRQAPASTTKLVTAMVALDRLDPDMVVKVSAAAAQTPSVSPRIRPGEKFSVRDLLNLALMRSVNSAAVALAEAAAGSEDEFAVLMNEKALSIGAESTRFINASGLPGDGQYITAHDLAIVMQHALHYPLIREIVNTRAQKVYTENGRKLFLKNTNHLLWSDDDMLGGKTGYTRAARHCFVGAGQKDDRLLIAAVLGEAVRDNLWQDTTRLLDRGGEVLALKRDPEIYYASVSMELAPLKVAKKKRIARAKYASMKKTDRKVAVKKKGKATSAAKKDAKKKKDKSLNAELKTSPSVS